jgi:hypothetical protein
LGEGSLSSRAETEGVDEIIVSDQLEFQMQNLIYYQIVKQSLENFISK